jgi:hypothetical protein
MVSASGMTPFEWMLFAPEGTSSAFLNPAELTIASTFLMLLANPYSTLAFIEKIRSNSAQ